MPGPRKRSAATRNAYYNRTRGGAATSTAAPATDPYAPYWEAYGIAATSPHGKMVLDLIKDGELVDEAFDIIADRFNLGPYAPEPSGGSGRTQFPSEVALDVAQAKRLGEQTAIDKAQLEADKTANLRREMNDLRQARISERVRAREGGVELAGGAPFRTPGTLRARAVQGPTMIDQFKQELGQAASFQEPMLGPNASVADLESAIAKLSEPILPQGGASSPFRPQGLEKGGEIGKEGEVTPFTMGRPDPFTAIEMAPHMGMTPIIVGERSGGPELMLAPKGTKVIPLTDDEEEKMMSGPFTGMATGGTVTGQFSNFGLEGIQDLLRSLRERTGLGGPLANPTANRTINTGDVLQRGQAAALGAFQRAPGTLVQSSAGGPVFIVDETGRLRGYTSGDVFRKSGQSFANVQKMQPNQIARFERGENITSPFSLPAGGSGGGR